MRCEADTTAAPAPLDALAHQHAHEPKYCSAFDERPDQHSEHAYRNGPDHYDLPSASMCERVSCAILPPLEHIMS